MKLEQQRERERYREAASRKRDQDKVLKLDRRIATLKERQLRKHQKAEELNRREEERSFNAKVSWHHTNDARNNGSSTSSNNDNDDKKKKKKKKKKKAKDK